MRFIFDFDHTLFATEHFMAALALSKERADWVKPQIWDSFNGPSFLYEDTLAYLESLSGHEVILLTAWTPSLGPLSCEFQKAKVLKSGIMPYLTEVIVMEGDKGTYVRDLCGNEPTVFIDDRVDHLLSAKALCPKLIALQMMRPSAAILPTAPAIPVITKLAEIDPYLTT